MGLWEQIDLRILNDSIAGGSVYFLLGSLEQQLATFQRRGIIKN